jgi:hypothetical protein
MLDVDAVDGSPQNPAMPYTIAAGQEVALGSWRLDAGDNKLVISGVTFPIRANTQLSIEVKVTI